MTVAYMLRTCAADMTSHGGFVWPVSGPVAASDWSPEPECGGGLHGLAWGIGDGGLLCWDRDARWLVVEHDPAEAVDLGGKIKVPRGVVVHCGDRASAIADIIARGAHGPVVGADYSAGYGGTATAGYKGTATAGDYGIATAGYKGTAAAGSGGEIRIRWFDGNRSHLAIGYVGEHDIESGHLYRAIRNGNLEKVK